MALSAIVNGPAPVAAAHSLVASAQVVNEPDNRWEAGYAFTPEGCVGANPWRDCPTHTSSTVVTVNLGTAPMNVPQFTDGVQWMYTSPTAIVVQMLTGVMSMTIDWGDGTPDAVDVSGPTAHTYNEGSTRPFRVTVTYSFAGSEESTGKSDPERLDVVEFDPVLLELAATCTTVGYDTLDYPGRARRQMELATTKALESEFWTGATKPWNPHLAAPNAVVLNVGGIANPTPMTPGCALAALNQALGDCGIGGRGMIHSTIDLATLWSNISGGLMRDGQRLTTTVRDTTVVAGAGYTGSGPNGADPPAGSAWAYATGPVQVRLGDIQVVPDTVAEAVDRHSNEITYRGERMASAAWDTCCLAAALVQVCDTVDFEPPPTL